MTIAGSYIVGGLIPLAPYILMHEILPALWVSIGVTLLAIIGQRRPSKYDLAMLSIVAAGGATLEEIVPILNRRHRERDLAKIRDAKRRQSHVKPK